MKTIEINLYKFDELSEQAKQKAVENLYDINVDHDWYDFVYEDANNIGCIIKGFDIGRGSSVNLVIDDDHIEVAQAILENWGEKCDGHKESQQFIEDFKTVSEDDLADLEYSYRKTLENVFLNLLRNEYEYRMTDEAIIETIEANDYDFTEDGKIY